jgi:hypothetical protein
MRHEKVSQIAGLISAAVVATLTCAVAAHAVQTITTANAATVAYNLAGGAISAPITPPANLPVFVMADQILATGCVGSSDMTVVNSAGQSNALVWNGIEDGGGFTPGISAVFGTHMMFIDLCHSVQIEVFNKTSFVVANGAAIVQKGNVTEIW